MRNEIRFAVRGLLRDRVFALMIVLSLAVGIGANTAIFSLINGVLLRPPDFPHPERLVALTQWAPKLLKAYPALPVNISIYAEWRKQVTSFEQVGIARASVFNLTGSGQPEQVRGAMVSSTIFPVFGVQPHLGRSFTEQEDQSGNDQVVILADSLWRRRYRADPAIVGRKILLDGKPYEVVGVLPASFHFPREEKSGAASLGEGLEIYKPLGYDPGDLKVHMGDFNLLDHGPSAARRIAGPGAGGTQRGASRHQQADSRRSRPSRQPDSAAGANGRRRPAGAGSPYGGGRRGAAGPLRQSGESCAGARRRASPGCGDPHRSGGQPRTPAGAIDRREHAARFDGRSTRRRPGILGTCVCCWRSRQSICRACRKFMWMPRCFCSLSPSRCSPASSSARFPLCGACAPSLWRP